MHPCTVIPPAPTFLSRRRWRAVPGCACPPSPPSPRPPAGVAGCDLVIERLLGAGTDVNAPSAKGLTAILAASERGMEPVVAQLIEARADVTRSSDSGLTPLVVASVNGHEGVVRRLLDAGANVTSLENIAAIVLAGKHGHRQVLCVCARARCFCFAGIWSFCVIRACARARVCVSAWHLVDTTGAPPVGLLRSGGG